MKEYNEDFRNFYSSPNIIKGIKSGIRLVQGSCEPRNKLCDPIEGGQILAAQDETCFI
jgi:hypothetical protein